jgi:hypothetical protein
MLGCPDVDLRHLGASNRAAVAHAETDIEAVASGRTVSSVYANVVYDRPCPNGKSGTMPFASYHR